MQAITEWLFEEIGKAGGGDPRSSPVVTRQLIESARTARERLSNSAETDVPLPMSDGHIAYTTLTRCVGACFWRLLDIFCSDRNVDENVRLVDDVQCQVRSVT